MFWMRSRSRRSGLPIARLPATLAALLVVATTVTVWVAGLAQPVAAAVTLTFAGRMGPAELGAYTKLLNAYKQSHPGIEIRIENYDASQYDNKILVEMAAGNAPDVMYIHYTRFPQYAKSGALTDLTPFIEADKFDLNQFFPATLMQLRYNGKTGLAIPRETSSITMFYNTDLFDKQGLPYPTANWSYDDLLEYARKLTRDTNGDGTNEFWGINAPTAWFLRVNVLWAFGGDILNPSYTQYVMDQPAAVNAIQWIADLFWKHKVAPPNNQPYFSTGQVGMMYAGYWDIGYNAKQNFKWDVQILPQGPAGRFVRVATGGHAIPAGSKHKKEAWELLKYLSSHEAMLVLAESGTSMPALRSAALTPAVISGYPEHRRLFVESLQYGRVDPVTTVWDKMIAELDKALGPVWTNEKTAAQALSGVRPIIDTLLKQQ